MSYGDDLSTGGPGGGGSLWKRISLELSGTWPGQLLLRFEPAQGPAVMVEVDWPDLAVIARLGTAAVSTSPRKLRIQDLPTARELHEHDMEADPEYRALWEQQHGTGSPPDHAAPR